jgi:hypothetical protein
VVAEPNREGDAIATFVQVALLLAPPYLYSQDTPSQDPRRYDAGPLTAADFRAAVPKTLPPAGRFTPLAKADSDIHFAVRFEYRKSADAVEAELTEIDIYAVFLPDTSWHSRPGDKSLMAHEKGHFDLTQIYALEALVSFRKQLGDGKKVIGRGADKNAAQADLESQIRALLKPVYERAAVAQQDYDRQTGHGTDAAAQARHRQRQVDLLSELARELSPSP